MENKKQAPVRNTRSTARPKSESAPKSKPAPAPRPKTQSSSRPKPAPASKPRPAPAVKPKQEDPEEVRLMKVKMRKSEFDKFDRGETHSQKGIRDEKGKLSALPDVEPVSKDDLPVRTVVQKQEPGVKEQVLEAGAEALSEAVGEVVGELVGRALELAVEKLTDPELYRTIGRKTKQIWNESVKPAVQAAQDRRKEKKSAKKAQLQIDFEQPDLPEVSVPETQDQTTFVVCEEQAAFLIEDVRNDARKLAEKIYVLSHLCIKNEKTDVERTLEQAYIQELMSVENQKVIEQAVAHPELVGEKVALCFSDLQNGYIRNEDKLIEIPDLKKLDNDEQGKPANPG